jgi:hypothetical protein
VTKTITRKQQNENYLWNHRKYDSVKENFPTSADDLPELPDIDLSSTGDWFSKKGNQLGDWWNK